MPSNPRPLSTILLVAAAAIAICTATGALQAQTAPGASTPETLPKPEAPFAGQIGPTYKEWKADFPKPITAPAGAPNVLIVILDDVGFGHAAAFGGAVATPTMDRLAQAGVRHNQFHTTALCSPTRAALLTGRNHHSVGTGVIIEMGTGFPGYTGTVPNTTAGLPEMLRQNGYGTAAFGKWHNTPDNVQPARATAGRPEGLGASSISVAS